MALALSFAGVALAQGTGAGGGAPLLGAALVFAAVCCEATYTLVGRRVIADASPVLVACLAALMSIPLFLPFAWRDLGAVTRARQRRVDRAGLVRRGHARPRDVVLVLRHRRAQGSVAAGFMGLMPVSALVLSYILLGEPFLWIHLAGFATVFAGVLLMSWEHARAG